MWGWWDWRWNGSKGPWGLGPGAVLTAWASQWVNSHQQNLCCPSCSHPAPILTPFLFFIKRTSGRWRIAGGNWFSVWEQGQATSPLPSFLSLWPAADYGVQFTLFPPRPVPDAEQLPVPILSTVMRFLVQMKKQIKT